MGRWVGLLAAVVALAGCKSTADPKPSDRELFGFAAGRNRPKDGPKDGQEPKAPSWLEPVARLPGGDTAVPTPGSWSGNPKSPNFDPKLEARDAVGGRVVDAFNRPARNIFIRIEGVNDPPGTAAKGIYTDDQGYFFTRGLKPDATYNLTAEATQDGKRLTGVVQTRVPNPVLTIVLREDLGLPPVGTPRPGSGNALGSGPPTAPRGPTAPRPRGDGAFAPDAVPTRPVPTETGSPPAGDPLPPPDDLATPTGKPHRPENVADTPRPPWQPPTTNIPGPPAPVYPVPPPAPPPPAAEPPSARPRPTPGFTLLDSQERPWRFPEDRSGSLVLLEFVTSQCVHCKPVVPVLKDLQARYATAGLQVVAVLCDEVPQAERAAAAARYGREYNLNYAVFLEPGSRPGRVRDRLGVEAYPTAVLLDGQGAILWRGHPGKRAELEAAVRAALGPASGP